MIRRSMISHCSQKVREGKIVKVEVECNDVIKHLRITGDFFLHPEDVLDDIEKSMAGLRKDVDLEALVFMIENIVKAREAQMIGISPESVASVILEALK